MQGLRGCTPEDDFQKNSRLGLSVCLGVPNMILISPLYDADMSQCNPGFFKRTGVQP